MRMYGSNAEEEVMDSDEDESKKSLKKFTGSKKRKRAGGSY